MSNTNKIVFKGLLIVAWLIFVGLCIEAGGLIVNMFFTLYKPDFLDNLYQKLDLTEMYRDSKPVFFGIYSFILVIATLKAYLFYVVVRFMHNLDLSNPFNSAVSAQISSIGYNTISIGFLGLIAGQVTGNLDHYGFVPESLNQFWSDSQAFILMGAVIYIIATIFRKGVELQSENDLTV